MKKLLIMVFMSCSISLIAQDNVTKNDEIKTLFGGEIAGGFYGSYDMKVTSFTKNAGLMTGGKGGWIINHQLVVGGGGFGLSTHSSFDISSHETRDSFAHFQCGYGGLLIEYIIWPEKPVHASFPLLVGAGGVRIHESENGYFLDYTIGRLLERSSFFVVEPGIDLELNLLKWIRFGVGMSYRYVYGSNLLSLTDGEMSGLSMNFSFKFGYF
ncbi:MAG: hypothetical protein ISR55_05310 [Bacteroidetes bacterium]|nr:hypothetical protein [Bacteroidota bacterium]MBL6963221.1 hypothetical protein [Bacteroidota bacterium]